MNLVTLRTYLMFMSFFVVVLASSYSCMNAIKEEIFNRREGLTFSFFFFRVEEYICKIHIE